MRPFRYWGETKLGDSMDPMKCKNYRALVDAGKNGGEETARSAFYNPRNRKPSLPKLKFLEGKD